MNTMAPVVFPDNPFAVLGVCVAADRAAIARAHEDAVLDGRYDSEAVLDRARQDIMTPRTRLEAELGFFPALGQEDADRLLADLREQGRSDLAQAFTGLDRANYMALHCRPGMGKRGLANARALVDHHDGILAGQVRNRIEQARRQSGFGPVAADDFDRAFADWRQRHARLVLDRFDTDGAMPAHVDKLVAVRDRQDLARGLIPALLREYEGRQAAALEEHAQAVREALARVDATAPPECLDALARALRNWAGLAGPLQQADALRGIDEAHSRALFDTVRDHYLNLHNTHNASARSLAVARLAQEVFSELPEAATMLARDIADLEEQIAWAAQATPRHAPPKARPAPARTPPSPSSPLQASSQPPRSAPHGIALIFILILALILWLIRFGHAVVRYLLAQRGKLAGTVIAAVVGITIIGALHDRPPANHSPSETQASEATPDTVEMPAYQEASGYESPGDPANAPILPVAPALSQDAPLSPHAAPDDGSEIAPAAYTTVPLGLGELRYCLKQKARLEAVQGEIADSTQNDRFNAAVEAYNPRCGRFSYDRTDMATVENEIRNQGSQLHAQGQAILEGSAP